ncbi:MAG: DUF4238 domain-containing protein [Phycisphaeraceae bacterium]
MAPRTKDAPPPTVPCAYLNRFVTRADGRLRAYPTTGGRCRCIAAATHGYTTYRCPPVWQERGATATALNAWLNEPELWGPGLLACLPGTLERPAMRELLSLYLGMILVRQPQPVVDGQRHEQLLVQELLEQLLAHVSRLTAAGKADPQLLARVERIMDATFDQASKTDPPQYPTGRWGVRLRAAAEYFATRLMQMHWLVLQAPAGEHFVTSDNPIVIGRHDATTQQFVPATLHDPEVTVAVPLSHKLVLWAHRHAKRGVSFGAVSANEVAGSNYHMARTARRWIYSPVRSQKIQRLREMARTADDHPGLAQAVAS